MNKVIEIILLCAGLGMVAFAPRIANQRVAARFSTTDLESDEISMRKKIARFRAAAITVNVLLGAAVATMCAVNVR